MMRIYYLIQVIAAVINKSPVNQYEELSPDVVNVHVACVTLLLLIFLSNIVDIAFYSGC
mgnify:CR=1 FL=1